MLGDSWGRQGLIRASAAMGSEQTCSEALLVDFLRDLSFGPNSAFGAKLEQTPQHAQMHPLDLIRERLGEDVRRHAASGSIS